MSGIVGHLVEDYRPQSVDDLILPINLKKQLKEFVKLGEIPCILMSGSPGVGKTASALALCNDIGCSSQIINGSKDLSMEKLRTDVQSAASSRSLMHPDKKKIIIIDEADGLRIEVQRALKTFIEEFAPFCRFIFTCNEKNKIIPAIISRCANITYDIPENERSNIAKSIFQRITSILDSQQISYKPEAVSEVVKQYFPDFRRMLNEIQSYAASGEIDEGILAAMPNHKFSDLIKLLKSKDFHAVYDWVHTNGYISQSELFSQLYDNVRDIVEDVSLPQFILTIDAAITKAPTSLNPKSNMMSCFILIMADTVFK